MPTPIESLQEAAIAALKSQYNIEVSPAELPFQDTRREFEGDFTLVVFPLTKYKLGSPEQIGQKLGEGMQIQMPDIERFNVVKGFLNLRLSDAWWLAYLGSAQQDPTLFRNTAGEGHTVVVEYCSPNTNKPLHLGHLRNIVLGYSLSQILESNGYKVIQACLFNDRGTNISKSMHAWLKAGTGDTPESTGTKGDKLVGEYYVRFGKDQKQEIAALVAEGKTEEQAEQLAPSSLAIQDLTIRWENGDADVRSLWKTMNGWVYAAMEQTFRRLGAHFDRYYFESDIYLSGKETVQEGLEKGIFYQKEDGSVWVDLSPDGLDHKLLLRRDGTSVYITQDLALADEKYRDYQMGRSIHVVGNEQEYHFKVLFLIMQKLGKPFASGLFHLSYGMVELPTGKMKTREGTVVDADDLMDLMISSAREETLKLGKTEGMSETELEELYARLGIGALKYYLVKVDPKKRILFDPQESIDLHGHTAPFIQSSYTRTASILRKAEAEGLTPQVSPGLKPEDELLESERSLLRMLMHFRDVLADAAQTYNPSLVANYAYELAKEYNRFYHEAPVIRSAHPATSAFRLGLSTLCGKALRESLRLLGITVPERM
ncbi:MAG: arginine--tRNA ligase [Bacteroidetes bacterium]|nr:MAG: arginine--tRNA ligase [Bacteroidota bacterium]